MKGQSVGKENYSLAFAYPGQIDEALKAYTQEELRSMKRQLDSIAAKKKRSGLWGRIFKGSSN